MKSLLPSAGVFFIAATMTAGASPTIFTFDDLTPGTLPGHDTGYEGPIPNGYNGFQWQNLWVSDTTLLPYASGYQNGVQSLKNVVFNGGGTTGFFSGTQFDLNSAYIGAAWNDGLSVNVQGFNGSTLLYNNTYIVNTSGSTLINFNYLGVTKVQFTSFGGAPHGFVSGSGTQIVLDNLSVTVPEPSVISLFSFAVAGWFVSRRRRSA